MVRDELDRALIRYFYSSAVSTVEGIFLPMLIKSLVEMSAVLQNAESIDIGDNILPMMEY